jgi:hypothetical protein
MKKINILMSVLIAQLTLLCSINSADADKHHEDVQSGKGNLRAAPNGSDGGGGGGGGNG